MFHFIEYKNKLDFGIKKYLWFCEKFTKKFKNNLLIFDKIEM